MEPSALVASLVALSALALGPSPGTTGRIVAEWEPGITEAEAGGPLVVDGYGITGLGAYELGHGCGRGGDHGPAARRSGTPCCGRGAG